MAARYEYKVEEIRERMVGGKMSGDKLEKVLNARAGEERPYGRNPERNAGAALPHGASTHRRRSATR